MLGDNIKLFTLSFGNYDQIFIDLIKKDGLIGGLSTGFYYMTGVNSAVLAAYGALGKEAPEMVVSPASELTPQNFREVWDIAYGIPIPDEVEKELLKYGY